MEWEEVKYLFIDDDLKIQWSWLNHIFLESDSEEITFPPTQEENVMNEEWKPTAGEEVFVNLQGRKYRTRFVGVDSVGRGVFELHSGMASIYGEELGFDSLDMSQFSPIPKTKLIHGVEVPDISFVPEMDNWYYHPVPDLPRLFAEDMHTIHSDNYTYRVNAGLCYPYTEEGKQAAILHAKAMLGIVEQTDKGE